jgi:hypothetical protein
VQAFTDAMHDVYDTYKKVEDGNTTNFRSMTKSTSNR